MYLLHLLRFSCCASEAHSMHFHFGFAYGRFALEEISNIFIRFIAKLVLCVEYSHSVSNSVSN
jgi:hypothetical protein